MATVIPLFTNQLLAVGSHPYGPTVVPVGIASVQLDLSTASTPVGSTLVATLERSTDGGTTWLVVNRAEMEGGISPKTGLPANLRASMTQDVVQGQFFRGSLIVTGTGITLTATATLN